VKNAVVLIEPIKFRMVNQSETMATPLGSSSEGSGHSAVKLGNRLVTSKEPLQQWGVSRVATNLPRECGTTSDAQECWKLEWRQIFSKIA
jgi:hypothetical protein